MMTTVAVKAESIWDMVYVKMAQLSYISHYGKENSFGVDVLYDPGCNSTRPDYSLSLYFRG